MTRNPRPRHARQGIGRVLGTGLALILVVVIYLIVLTRGAIL